jgi:hypothetical protein
MFLIGYLNKNVPEMELEFFNFRLVKAYAKTEDFYFHLQEYL